MICIFPKTHSFFNSKFSELPSVDVLVDCCALDLLCDVWLVLVEVLLREVGVMLEVLRSFQVAASGEDVFVRRCDVPPLVSAVWRHRRSGL